MHLPLLSPNLVIIAVMIGGLIYGLVGGKHRLKILILSIYVGIVLATQLAALVVQAIHQPVDIVTLGLFILPIILFGFSGGHGGSRKEHNGTLLANLVVGLAAGALIAASALRLLPPSEASGLSDGSLVASLLMQYQLYLVGLLPVVALIFGLMKGKEHKSHH
jgi:zinc transporter ZupT